MLISTHCAPHALGVMVFLISPLRISIHITGSMVEKLLWIDLNIEIVHIEYFRDLTSHQSHKEILKIKSL